MLTYLGNSRQMVQIQLVLRIRYWPQVCYTRKTSLCGYALT